LATNTGRQGTSSLAGSGLWTRGPSPTHSPLPLLPGRRIWASGPLGLWSVSWAVRTRLWAGSGRDLVVVKSGSIRCSTPSLHSGLWASGPLGSALWSYVLWLWAGSGRALGVNASGAWALPLFRTASRPLGLWALSCGRTIEALGGRWAGSGSPGAPLHHPNPGSGPLLLWALTYGCMSLRLSALGGSLLWADGLRASAKMGAPGPRAAFSQ